MDHPDLSPYNLPQKINLMQPSCQELRITVDTLQQHMSSLYPRLRKMWKIHHLTNVLFLRKHFQKKKQLFGM